MALALNKGFFNSSGFTVRQNLPGIVPIEDSNGTRNSFDRGPKLYQRTQMVPGTVLDRETVKLLAYFVPTLRLSSYTGNKGNIININNFKLYQFQMCGHNHLILAANT